MGILTRKKPSLDELEEKKDYLSVESEVAGKEAEIEEKRQIVNELRKRYGRNWRGTLGLKSLDLQTLRSVLGGMKRGLVGMGGATPNSYLSPLPGKNLRR